MGPASLICNPMAEIEEDYSQSFTVYAETLEKHTTLTLHKNKVTIKDGETEVRCFNLKDVFGVKVGNAPGGSPPTRKKNKSRSTSDTTSCQAELCTYSVDGSLAKPKKKLKYLSFLFNTADSFEENKELAMKCRQSVQNQCLKYVRHNEAKIQPPDEVTMLAPIEVLPPRLLVVINPFSGSKKGVKEYQQTVQPMFELAGITVEELLITERQNHAKEFIQSFDFSRITGIVCVGGDGTLYEILNGIMCRQDWEVTINTPFGIIPTGSGNAILSSLLHEQSEEYSMLNAINQIIKGGTQVMSLGMVTMATQTSHITNAVTWGILADIDIESEVLRFLGGDMRYLFGTLKCILQKRTYRGRLSYLPVSNMSTATERQDGAGLEENTTTVHEQQQEMGHEQDNVDTEIQNGNAPDPTPPAGTSPIPSPPGRPSFPSLNDPVPSDWVTIEDDFVSIHVTLVPKLTRTMIGHPNAILGGNQFHIVCISGSSTRGGLLNVMQESESGEYVNHPGVTSYVARACRIEPLTDSGRLVVDGEPVAYGPMQIQIADTKMNLYSLKTTSTP